MIYKSNIGEVIDKVIANMDKLSNDKISRAVSVSMLGIVRHRIHQEGRGADGNRIGTYSPEYMKYRLAHGRTSDNMVVSSLTTQQENDFSVQPTDSGQWGLGYTNNYDYAKARFVENTYKKPIFSLTQEEETKSIEAAEDYVERVING